MTSSIGRRRPEPRCPLRPREVCNLCQLDVTGPQDCGLVYLVGADPDLRRHYGGPPDGEEEAAIRVSGGSVAS